MDDLTKEQRRKNMQRIHSKDTSIEVRVRKELWCRGFRYRKNVSSLPGKPDIVLAKYKTVIFVQGCFWHMHDCGRFHWPASNREYWEPKILRNVERDAANKEKLESMGWQVLTVWECELKKKDFDSTMALLIRELNEKKS